jgi:uncharacterized protein (TIGR04255 family)
MDSTSRLPREREIYPNAPLTLVAAEVRYPLSPRLAKVEPDVLLDRLGDIVPIVEEAQPVMQVMVGPPGAEVPTAPFGGRQLRLLSKARDLAVTLTGTNAIVETTTYERFEVLQEVLATVFQTLENVGPPAGVQRLGLRYIDEIRIQGVSEEPSDWRDYLDVSLLGAAEVVLTALGSKGYRANAWQGVTQLVGTEDRWLQVRHGAGLGTVVNTNGPLRFPKETDQRPAFILDLDSYWQPSEVGDFSVEILMQECERLHEPLSIVFERIITDRLRDEVLRNRGDG